MTDNVKPAAFSRVGKQIMAHGHHYADAADERAAEFILAALVRADTATNPWRPIAEAPKDDGYECLIINDRGMFVAQFDEAWDEGGWWMVSDGKDFERPLRGNAPTHFAPLPAGPTPGDAA